MLLPGLAFFGLSLLVPLRHAPVEAVDPLAAARLSELRELALALDETLELDEALRDGVAANLDSAEAGAREEELSGEALHEALDRVERLLEQRAGGAAEQLEMARAELARAAAGAASEDQARAGEAMRELGELAQELEALGGMPPGLSAAKLAEMSPGELASTLSEAAAAKLAQLTERGLLNSSQLAALAAASPSSLSPLEPLPGVSPGLPGSCEGGAGCGGEGGGHGPGCPLHGAGALPGRGGISRGPGSLPLTRGAETPDLAGVSLSGSLPGLVPVRGVFLPLNVDHFTVFGLSLVNTAVLPGAAGLLDEQGKATFQFHVEPGQLAPLIGQTISFAVITSDPDGMPSIGSSGATVTVDP